MTVQNNLEIRLEKWKTKVFHRHFGKPGNIRIWQWFNEQYIQKGKR